MAQGCLRAQGGHHLCSTLVARTRSLCVPCTCGALVHCLPACTWLAVTLCLSLAFDLSLA